jgi:CRISPR-associated endonuclease/helicase Cas3
LLGRRRRGGVETNFIERFRGLTGFTPMQWQTRLFERIVANDLPDRCDIATGLGKTSVIPIWLLAIVAQMEAGHLALPRRLFYVVNRRTVVDQATAVVEQLRQRLVDPENGAWSESSSALTEVSLVLRRVPATPQPFLAVSTLRGELADNKEWKVDPTRPAIVVGTIDMIGSKLLFSGYGDGRYDRAQHAGLVGQDSLIIHDEAHLTPAFGALLTAVAREQNHEAGLSASRSRPVRVVELSATSRGDTAQVFRLGAADRDEQVVRERLTAEKRLRCHAAKPGSLVEKLAGIAWTHAGSGAKVLIYVSSPESARQVAQLLGKRLGKGAASRLAVLTGTIRGHERDELVRSNAAYRCFCQSERPVDETVFLVSTSAGEVGVDLDADHLVCDATTLDSLVQRLGRVNRRGGRDRAARADLVHEATSRARESKLAAAVAATVKLLEGWEAETRGGIDVCPQSLELLLSATSPERVAAAYAPQPESRRPTDIVLDAWSLTSINEMPGRPAVAGFLHGLADDPPETHVAWRSEVKHLAQADIDGLQLGEWFRACRVETRELVRDSAARVKKILGSLLAAHRKNDAAFDAPAVLLDEKGEARLACLSDLQDDSLIANRIVVLPAEIGGLDEHGMLSASKEVVAPRTAIDVADQRAAERGRCRMLTWRDGEGGEVCECLAKDSDPALYLHMREAYRLRLSGGEDSESGEPESAVGLDLVVFMDEGPPADAAWRDAIEDVTLAAHLAASEKEAALIAAALGLDQATAAALRIAAGLHDSGKARWLWQRYARNQDSPIPLAKARRYLQPRSLSGYRHEFGSLLDAAASAKLGEGCDRDLVLHLIAAHHGWARPLFPLRADDAERPSDVNEGEAWQTLRRFDSLQQRYGRWTLAWLEALLRSADVAASHYAAGPATSMDLLGAGA